jgi:hypothetical protein
MRRLFFVSVLLTTAFFFVAIGSRPTVNATLNAAEEDCGCTAQSKGERLQLWPIHCLQQKWINYPGPFDMYICLTFYEDCYETGVEELWYGAASTGLPQICNRCEQEEPYGRAATAFPGHEWNLGHHNAWDVVGTGLETAGINTASMNPEFHKIPQDATRSLAIGRDLYVMAVPIEVSGKLGAVRYLCVETDSIPEEQVSEATFTHAKAAGTGAQFAVEYTVDGQTRKGFVWLKK